MNTPDPPVHFFRFQRLMVVRPQSLRNWWPKCPPAQKLPGLMPSHSHASDGKGNCRASCPATHMLVMAKSMRRMTSLAFCWPTHATHDRVSWICGSAGQSRDSVVMPLHPEAWAAGECGLPSTGSHWAPVGVTGMDSHTSLHTTLNPPAHVAAACAEPRAVLPFDGGPLSVE